MVDAEEGLENVLLIDAEISKEDDNTAVDEETNCNEEANGFVTVIIDESCAIVFVVKARCEVIEAETDCCIDLDTEDNLCEVLGDGTCCDVLVLASDIGVDVNPFVVKLDKEEKPCVAPRVEFLTSVVERNILV